MKAKNRSSSHSTFNTEHSTFNIKNKGSAPSRSLRRYQPEQHLREKSLLLKLLAVDAVRCPGDGGEAFVADRGAAVGAGAVRLAVETPEGLVDQHEEVALAVGEREVQFFGIGAGGLVGEVLDAIVGLGAGLLVALEGVENLVLLLSQRVDVALIGMRFFFCLYHCVCHAWGLALLTCGTECSASTYRRGRSVPTARPWPTGAGASSPRG